jgi:cation:H+ antiporter
MLLWLAFSICTAAIVYAGTRLSRYGDILAEKSGLGGSWIGVVLMASVTSLPELVTGISSVTFASTPDIAVGDVLGSCVFNLLILAILDAMHRPMPLSSKARQGHILSAGFGVLLLGLVALSLLLNSAIASLAWVGTYSLAFITIYFVAMRIIFSYEKKQILQFIREAAEELQYEHISTAAAVRGYGLHAVVVIIAAMFLPKIGVGIAAATGLGESFIGNIFIAVSTSLPEVVVSTTAVRIGAIDMAISNLFGSNLFNIFILGIDDLLFLEGPLLSFASRSHLIPTLSAIMMTAVAVIGLSYRAEKKRLPVAWDSMVIVLLYLINLLLLFGLH